MPQNRHTVKTSITIKSEIAQQFRNTANNLKIFMYCGMSQNMSPYSQADVAFPNQIEVKINDVEVKSNFKGLKNKPGSTKPADLTSLIRKFNGQENSLQVTYALTTKRFAFTVYLVRAIGADRLTERIRKGNVIRKQKVLDDMKRQNADPDIAATSIRMSLKDPISTLRITLPVRSSHCTHNQCFDGAMFLQLQEQAPQWSCPVCSKSVAFEALCIDEYFQDILDRTPKNTEKVDIEPNGEWKIIKDEDDSQTNGSGPGSKARASYDDDFDDDEIVEVDQPNGTKQVNDLKRESQQPGMLSPIGIGQPFSINTPPLSSREPSVAQSAASTHRPGSKRPQSAVIDLTLSDDEDDEPPRSAKRQQTSQSQSNTNQASNRLSNSSSYNTPASIPSLRLHLGKRPDSHSQAHAPDSNGSTTHSGGNQNHTSAASNSLPQYTFGGVVHPHRPSSSLHSDESTQNNSSSPAAPHSNWPAPPNPQRLQIPQHQHSTHTNHTNNWSSYSTNNTNPGIASPHSPFTLRPTSQNNYQPGSSPQPPSYTFGGTGSSGPPRLPPIQQLPSLSPPGATHATSSYPTGYGSRWNDFGFDSAGGGGYDDGGGGASPLG